MKAPRSVTVVVDSREQVPLLFPANTLWYPDRGVESRLVRIKTVTKKLDAGDYQLKGSNVCGIERKGSASELFGNLLTRDYKRFTAALDRFAGAFIHPYLLLDISITDLWTPTEYCPNPAKAWDCLIRELIQRKIGLLWGGSAKAAGPRQILGEQLVHLMLTHHMEETQCSAVDAKTPTPSFIHPTSAGSAEERSEVPQEPPSSPKIRGSVRSLKRGPSEIPKKTSPATTSSRLRPSRE